MIDNTHVRLRSSRAPYNRGGFRFLTTQAAAIVPVDTLTDAQIQALKADGQISIEFFTPEPADRGGLVILAPEVIERTVPTAQPITHPESPVEADPTAIAAAAAAVDPIAPVATGVTLGSPLTTDSAAMTGATTPGRPAMEVIAPGSEMEIIPAAAGGELAGTTDGRTDARQVVGATITDPLAGTGEAIQIPTRDAVTGEVIPPVVAVDQLGALAETTASQGSASTPVDGVRSTADGQDGAAADGATTGVAALDVTAAAAGDGLADPAVVADPAIDGGDASTTRKGARSKAAG